MLFDNQEIIEQENKKQNNKNKKVKFKVNK